MYIKEIDILIDDLFKKLYTYSDNENIQKSLSSIHKFFDKKYETDVQNILDKYYYMFIFLISKNTAEMSEEKFARFITGFRINILNSEVISYIIYLHKLINRILFIFKNLERIKAGKLSTDTLNNYKDVIDIINTDIGNENLDIIIKSKNIKYELIKILIYKYYITVDRVNISEQLEEVQLNNLETKYIEIIESIDTSIDIETIDNIIKTLQLPNYLVDYIFNIMSDSYQSDTLTDDFKIKTLFEKKIIIPITDEFLRYHKSTELYENREEISKNRKIDKISFITNRINQIADYYSLKDESKKKKIEELFYTPLMYRKVMIYNNNEEVKSINKLIKMGKNAIKYNEYFQDLINYRDNAYINFNEINKGGFSFKFDTPIEAIRAVNFENKKFFNLLETRVIGNKANIVGIAIPSNVPLQCVKIKNTFDLRELPNPYVALTDLLNAGGAKTSPTELKSAKKSNKLCYWLFDRKLDVHHFKTFDQNANNINNFFYQNIINEIYDSVSIITFQKIMDKLKENKYICINNAINIINYYQDKYVKLTDNDYNNLMTFIIYNTKCNDFTEKIYGKPEKMPVISIKDRDVFKTKLFQKHVYIKNDDTDHATCQHIITWNDILKHKRRDPSKFNELLYEFKNKYIINSDGVYICKSCYENVEISNFVADWSSQTEEGIALSLKLESALESLPQYEKYNKFIKNVDKIIEKIAMSGNITQYIGKLYQEKLHRQEVIKNVIDLLTKEYELFKLSNKKTFESNSTIYGIKKEYSKMFIFELKNDIFLYSSADIDKFKTQKTKNILAYIILMIINSINNIQIFSFIDPEIYKLYNTYSKSIFKDILIKINNSNDVSPLIDYFILSYTLFYIASILIKYKLWIWKSDNTKKFDENVYKEVIHTIIDILNYLLNKFKDNYLYETFCINFYKQLYTTYNDEININIINKLTGKEIKTSFDTKIIIEPVKYKQVPVYIINKKLLPYIYSETLIKNNYKLFYQQHIEKIKKFYNNEGFKKINDKDTNIDKLLISLDKNNLTYNNFLESKINEFNYKYKSTISSKNNIFKNIKDKYSNYKIDEFLEKMNTIIGNININNEHTYLFKNVYIISYDYYNNKLKDNIYILEGDRKIQFKKNDPFFKVNVYMYYDKNVIVYYHGVYLYMLGYKEANKEIVSIKDTKNYLKINYSYKRKLLFLGFDKLHYKIADNIVDLIKKIKYDRLINLRKIIGNVHSVIFKIKNKHSTEGLAEFENKFKNIIVSKGDENKIFTNMYDITSLSLTSIPDNINIQYSNNSLYISDIKKIFNTDDILLNYICYNLSLLLSLNDDKYTKTNLVFMILKIIDIEFKKYLFIDNIELFSFFNTFLDAGYSEYVETTDLDLIDDKMSEDDEKNFEMDVDIDQEDEDKSETVIFKDRNI